MAEAGDVVVERDLDGAVGPYPFGHLPGQFKRYQRVGFHPVEPADERSRCLRPGQVQDLPEPLRRQQADGGAPAGEEHVEGGCGAVVQCNDVASLHPAVCAHPGDARRHGLGRIGRRGRLGDPRTPAGGVGQHQIGERAARVDGECQAHGISRSRPGRWAVDSGLRRNDGSARVPARGSWLSWVPARGARPARRRGPSRRRTWRRCRTGWPRAARRRCRPHTGGG